MNRGKKAAYNSIASLVAEIIAIICGFVLPRLIISNFGSSYNGLTQSVSQFLSIVALMRAGVGGATRAALYKSLANNNEKQISATILATEHFMRKVALIFAFFVIAFSCVYPLIVRSDFDWFFSATLVLIISLSTFVEYYFGITYQILLQADQKQYISTILSAGVTILNMLLSVCLIYLGYGIHIVKLGSAIVFCITPIVLHFYVRRHYNIDKTVQPDFSSINQRWDAMFHQVAGFIYSNTDIMLITIFSNLREVSVYTTYCLVSNGLKKLMTTVTTGIEAAFGDMIARGDEGVLEENVRIYETLLHGIVCVLFGAALVLITPFVTVYTKGIQDVNYSRSLFGYLLIITEAIHLLRQPYHSIIEASGHYKETKKIAAMQAALNLGISIILINIWGLIGVIVGTLVSDVYRGIAYRIYVQRNILKGMSFVEIIKRLAVTALTVFSIFACSTVIPHHSMCNYSEWIIYALIITAVSIGITIFFIMLFYRKNTIILTKRIRDIVKGVVHRKEKTEEG